MSNTIVAYNDGSYIESELDSYPVYSPTSRLGALSLGRASTVDMDGDFLLDDGDDFRAGDIRRGQGAQTSRAASPLFASEAITQLSQWSPATNNLFEIEFDGISALSKMHCSAISFPGAHLEFERHKVTKNFMIEGYRPADELTITWREDSSHSVRKFHMAWFEKFYNKQGDYFISGIAGKAKNARVKMQKMDDRGFVQVASLELIGLLPTQLADLNMEWSSGDAIEYQLSYKVKDWNWRVAQ